MVPIDNNMAKDAAKPAPAETPSLSGATNGFLNNPWNDAPAMDSAAPTNMAASIRGNLTWNITVSIEGVTVELMGITWETRVIITSYGAIGYLPTKKERKNRIIKGMHSNIVTDILCLAILSLILFWSMSYHFGIIVSYLAYFP